MANLDTMRRAFALEEEAPAEGGLEPRTIEERLAQYAAMDAAEEANAGLAGVPVDELRYARRGDARVAEKIGGDMTAERVRALGLRNAGGIGVPSSMAAPPNRGFFNPTGAVGLERTGLRLNEPVDMPETVPSLSMPSGVPAKTTDFASLQKLMSPGALKAPEAQPIPVANAPSGSDATAPVTSALPSTGPQNPAGKPDSSGTQGLPAPSSEGAGGDAALGRLSLGQALTRALEGSGSVIAGRDLRSGAADTLGERMKQIEALRAKREEQKTEQAKASNFASRLPALFPGLTPEQQIALRETITAGGNVGDALTLIKQFKGAQTDKEVQQKVNEAALASAVARYPELATSFEALRPVAGEYPQKDFAAMLDKAAGGKAAFEAKGAATKFMVDKQGRFNQLTPIEVDKQKLQNDRLRQQIDLDAKTFKIKEREAEAAPGKTEQEFKEKLITLADKEKGFGGYINLASDLAALEAAAPGFVTQGKPPSWLTTESIATAQKFPRNADPKVISFLAAYADLSNTERHRLYGSAQTEGELRAFLQQLSDDPFFGGPEVMATQMRGFAQGTAKTATNTLNRYSKGFSPTSVATVFGDEFKPLYAEGGVFAGLGQKSPFVTAAKRKAQPENTTAMLDENGKPQYVPNDQVPAAEAAGWKRE